MIADVRDYCLGGARANCHERRDSQGLSFACQHSLRNDMFWIYNLPLKEDAAEFAEPIGFAIVAGPGIAQGKLSLMTI